MVATLDRAVEEENNRLFGKANALTSAVVSRREGKPINEPIVFYYLDEILEANGVATRDFSLAGQPQAAIYRAIDTYLSKKTDVNIPGEIDSARTKLRDNVSLSIDEILGAINEQELYKLLLSIPLPEKIDKKNRVEALHDRHSKLTIILNNIKESEDNLSKRNEALRDYTALLANEATRDFVGYLIRVNPEAVIGIASGDLVKTSEEFYKSFSNEVEDEKTGKKKYVLDKTKLLPYIKANYDKQETEEKKAVAGAIWNSYQHRKKPEETE